MINWIKKFLGINVQEQELISKKLFDLELCKIRNEFKRDVAIINDNILKSNKELDAANHSIQSIQDIISIKTVKVKFNGWKREQEFIELSMKIYILDNGFRKKNKPFVKIDNNGVIDEYDTSVRPESKMRCYMLKKLILPGYLKEDLIIKGADESNFDFLFGRSYRELVSYMAEFNYEKKDEGMYTLNFYEI